MTSGLPGAGTFTSNLNTEPHMLLPRHDRKRGPAAAILVGPKGSRPADGGCFILMGGVASIRLVPPT